MLKWKLTINQIFGYVVKEQFNANIDHLPVKIKKILNISRDFIEISEYIDN